MSVPPTEYASSKPNSGGYMEYNIPLKETKSTKELNTDKLKLSVVPVKAATSSPSLWSGLSTCFARASDFHPLSPYIILNLKILT